MENINLNTNAYYFWKRVDSERSKKGIETVKHLAILAGIKPQRMNDQRSDLTFPKLLDSFSIAKILDTTVEYLITGEHLKIENNYPVKVKKIADKLCNISDMDFALIERNVELIPEKNDKIKESVVS